jgi:hypothetical protein
MKSLNNISGQIFQLTFELGDSGKYPDRPILMKMLDNTDDGLSVKAKSPISENEAKCTILSIYDMLNSGECYGELGIILSPLHPLRN